MIDARIRGLLEGPARAAGARIWDASGHELIDCTAMPLGHNHPAVRAALAEVLRREPAATGRSPLATALLERLGRLAPGELATVRLLPSRFAAVEAALELARRATRRRGVIACEHGAHGARGGTAALGGGRGAALRLVPFGDLGALERGLAQHDVATFLVEPMPWEGGVRPPPPTYLSGAASLCRRHGAVLLADEGETALGRTGAMTVCEAEGVEPGALIVGEALGAGLAPQAALLTSRALWARAYGSDAPPLVGTPLSWATGLATLEVIAEERLLDRAQALGQRLGIALRMAGVESPLVHQVRGRGLMWGIEFKAETALRALTLRVIDTVTDGLLPAWVANGLRARGFAARVASEAPDVLQIAAPLVIDEASLVGLGEAFRDTLGERARGALRAGAGAVVQELGRLVDRLRRGTGEGEG